MSENNASMFVLAPIPSPEDIIRNKSYHECKEIIKSIENNIHNFMTKYNNDTTQTKMSKTLRFVYDELITMLKNITSEEERILDFITNITSSIVDERETKLNEESKKKYLSELAEAGYSDKRNIKLIKETLSKFKFTDNDYNFVYRLLTMYEHHESTYFVMATNIVKLYNTLVDIYQINEIDKGVKNTKELEKSQKEMFGDKEIIEQPDPIKESDKSWFYSNQSSAMGIKSMCDNCRADVDGDLCPKNGEVCIRSRSMSVNDLYPFRTGNK